jgi:putative phosphoesterase
MRLAIFSDVHANFHALESVWADIQKQKPDAIYCLGDLVGYGAEPNEVIDFIKTFNVPTIMGNYDDGVGFDLDDCGCVYKNIEDDRRGKQSLMWSRERVTPNRKEFLRKLPIHIRKMIGGRRFLLVHGSPRKMNEYLYEERPLATFEHVAKVAGCDILLFGHTHLPYQKRVGSTLFVNTGSVGKPKDGDPRAGYVLIDLAKEPKVEFRRVSYDVELAAQAIRKSGLPPHFADLLTTGGVIPSPQLQGVK